MNIGNSDRYLHSIDEHSSQSERDFFGEFLPGHGNFETITEINVKNLATQAIQHQVRRVAISKTQNVSDHRHHSQRSEISEETHKKHEHFVCGYLYYYLV